MLKNLRKLNRIIAVSVLPIMFVLSTSPSANAGILSWFSGNQNDASASEHFSSLASYLGVDGLLVNGGQKGEDLPVVQSSSLVSVDSPINVKKIAKLAPIVEPVIMKIKSEVDVMVTAYSSTPDQTDSSPFITAMGSTVRDGIVAANFLPFGTKIKMPEIYGDKIFVVEDRMNRRYWHVVDIWFPDRLSALQFGVKKIKIQIIES